MSEKCPFYRQSGVGGLHRCERPGGSIYARPHATTSQNLCGMVDRSMTGRLIFGRQAECTDNPLFWREEDVVSMFIGAEDF